MVQDQARQDVLLVEAATGGTEKTESSTNALPSGRKDSSAANADAVRMSFNTATAFHEMQKTRVPPPVGLYSWHVVSDTGLIDEMLSNKLAQIVNSADRMYVCVRGPLRCSVINSCCGQKFISSMELCVHDACSAVTTHRPQSCTQGSCLECHES
jgi:hypothetical protein